jgi:hypothetical protein
MEHVAWHDHHRDAPEPEGMLDRAAREPRHLLGLAEELTEVAAFGEEPLRMRLLEEARAELRAGDL